MNQDTQNRVPITALVLCYNEERNIERCLQSLTWADDILVVDSFSSDRTLEIARRHTDHVLQHVYEDWGLQQEWAAQHARHPWIFNVDADEEVSPELAEGIRRLMVQGPAREGYWVTRDNYLYGRRVRYSGWSNDRICRVFRRERVRFERKRIHMHFVLENPADTEDLPGRLIHHPVPVLSLWLSKINSYSALKAQDKFEKGLRFPLLEALLRPPLRFLKDYFFRLGILDGWRGFLIAGMSAFSEFVTAMKVFELGLGKERGRPGPAG